MSSTLTYISGTRPARKRRVSPKLLRHAVMAFFFLFLLHVAYDHQVKGGGPRGTPSVEAYCPFGGIENLYQFLTTGGFIRRIEPSAMIMLGALVLLTLVASRGFCGWICPFGSVQEWIGLAGRKLLKRRFNPTGAWDRGLRYLKYVILAAVVALTWHTGTLVFRDYDPFLAFFHLGRGVEELPWAYAALGVVLAGSLFIERFFCKYACPLGAVLAVLGRLGLSKIHRDPDGCKSCRLCEKKCTAHVDFLSVTTIRDPECNHCMDCVADCPKPHVLTLGVKRWHFSHPVYAGILVAGLAGFIGASRLAGKWQTTPASVSFTNARGQFDAENLRGWMTISEIATGYGIPLESLYRGAGLPARVPPTARLNTIARTYGIAFEPETVRDLVRAHLAGRPVAPPQPADAKHAPGSEPEVRGMMTLNEIALKTGVPKSYLLERMQLAQEIDGRVPVREWMHAHGKSIEDLRDAVRAYRAAGR